MISSLTLADASGSDVTIHAVSPTAKRALITAKGLIGVGPLRESKRVRPSAHGSINETRFEEGRTIALEGEVASGVSIEDAISEFRAITRPMLQTLDFGPALMKWTEGSAGNKLQLAVKLDSDIEPVIKEVDQRLVYQANFFAEDPRAYSQTQSSVKGSGITGTAQEAKWLKTSATTRPFDVKVDATRVYWVDRQTKAIGRAKIDGTAIEPEWIKTSYIPNCIHIDGSHIYWGSTTNQPAIIGRAAIGGTAIENTWVTTSIAPYAISAITGNGTNIFYAYGRNIGRMNAAGAGLEDTWKVMEVATNAITLNASYIYFGWEAGIGRMELAGGEVNPNWMVNTGLVRGVAVNASNIFWTDAMGRTIGRAKIDGSEPFSSFIVGLETQPWGIAIDASHIYWGEYTGYIARSKELTNGGPLGSNCVVSQAGNRPAPLTFKIVGPLTNPSIIRKSDGARIALRGTVATGNFVEVSVAARNVLLNGSSNLLAFLDAPGTNWSAFEAPTSPGSETYQLTASSATAATLEAIYRSAYA